MIEMTNIPEEIIKYLLNHRSVDFSGYNRSLFNDQLNERVNSTETENISQYYLYLQSHPHEVDIFLNQICSG